MLYFGCPMTGFAYGAIWALFPGLSAELYGIKTIGQTYNFLNFGPMIGSIVMSEIIVGRFYDYHADEQHNSDSNVCYGKICFQDSFLIFTCSCILATFASLYLWKLYRHKR